MSALPRRLVDRLLAASSAVLLLSGLTLSAVLLVGMGPAAGASTTMSLLLPQSTAFSILGHSCGGIQEEAFATGFDTTSGFPTGDVRLQTRCGGSGRGGGYHTTTYTAWAEVTWDFTGAVVADTVLPTAPTVDSAFSAFDAYGNEVYNASNLAYLTLSPTFVPAPRVTAISTSSGPASGGTSVTITGTGFSGATDVEFGSTAAASFVVNGDTSITALSPSTAAGTVDVTVTTPGGPSAASSADQFSFVAAPVVSGLSPDQGPLAGGTTVTITGTGFTDATTVAFGDVPVGFTVLDDTSIEVVTPAGDAPDSVAVTVSSIGGTSAGSPADQFTYVATNPVVSVSPPAGGPGTSVEISGSGFAPGETIKVSYATGVAAPRNVVLCKSPADDTGAFSCAASVPTTNAGAPGHHKITAKGTTSLAKATVVFTLT